MNWPVKLKSPTHLIALSFLIAAISAGVPCRAEQARIVSLNPAITEILFDLGVGDQIVGTSEWSDQPEEAKKIPRIGSYLHPNFEAISKLKPTDVVFSNEGEDNFTAKIEKVHAKAIALSLRALADFEPAAKKLGEALLQNEKAKHLIKLWNAEWTQLKPNLKGKSVLILLDTSPLVAAGKDSFLSEAFGKCGLKNLITQTGYPRLSGESAWTLKADYVLVVQHVATQALNLDWPKSSTTKIITLVQPELGRLSLRLPSAVQVACEKIARVNP